MIALYPIKPKYINRILAGEKKFELRKRLPRHKIKYVLLYSTNPVRKTVGYGEVKRLHEDTVPGIWSLVSGRAGIDRKSYYDYFADSTKAYAIEFKHIYKFARPFPVKEIAPDITVPQSFCYISGGDFARLKKRRAYAV